jgi:uncharacterized membrane protein
MVGAFVALTVVAIVQFARGRDPRLLPVMAMAALQALTLFLETGGTWKNLSQGAVCVAGLVLIFMLSAPSAPPAKGSR